MSENVGSTKQIRRLVPLGKTSVVVTVPKLWLKKLKIKKTDFVRLGFNEDEGTITIHQIDPKEFTPRS